MVVILILVIYLSINRKFYISVPKLLLVGGPSEAGILTAIQNRFLNGAVSGSADSKYTSNPSSSFIVVVVKFIYYSFTVIAYSVFTLLKLRSKDISLYPPRVRLSLEEWVGLLLVLSFLPDMLVTAFAGAIRWDILTIITPIFAVYLLVEVQPFDIQRTTLIRSCVALLLLVAITGQIGFYQADTQMKIGPAEQNEQTATWIYQHAQSNQIMTDYASKGLINTYLAQAGYHYSTLTYQRYSASRYESLIGEENDRNGINSVLIHRETTKHELVRGFPDWTRFKPLGPYTNKIDSNPHFNKVYDNELYWYYI
jgi:hypothetical protein